MTSIDNQRTKVDSTYCPDLWEMYSIDNMGGIYHCCHIMPERLGDIHASSLDGIINCEKSIRYRRLSLRGELRCYHSCNWVDKEIPSDARKEHLYIEYNELRRLHIHFGERCNIACIMCKQVHREPLNTALLDSNILIRNIDLAPFEDVVLSGGETLLIEEAWRYMRHLASVGKRFTVLTNGLLIDDGMAEFLSTHAKKVVISMNAASREVHEMVNVGSSYDTVVRNIGRLKTARDRKGTDMRVVGRMTITVPALHEVPIFIRDFGLLGFDGVNFGFDRATVLSYLEGNPLFAESLRNSTMEALKKANIEEVDVSRLQQLGLTDGGSPIERSGTGRSVIT